MTVLRCSQKLLKRLRQPAALLDVCGIRSPLADAEIEAWQRPCVFARTTDRSLVSSMNQRKYEAWAQLAYRQIPAFDVACLLLDTPFHRKDLGRDFHVATDLVRARLLPSAKIIPFEVSRAWH